MPENVQHCPLCRSTQSNIFDRRDFRGQSVINRLCRRCGLVYQSPRMRDDELAAFYEQEYRQVYQGGADPTQKDLSVQSGRAKSLLSFVNGRVEKSSRHLDIGCSAGILLQQFQIRYHCQSVGVEPGEAYRSYAQSQGFCIYPSLTALEAAGELPFDFISLAHVLEHWSDPIGYLTRLGQRCLSPDGWLLLEVPNLYAHDCFEIAHLISFSVHTLRQTLTQAGFEVVACQKHGRPRSALLPLYLTVLARPHSCTTNPLIPEHAVRLKRWLGMAGRRIIERLFPRQAWLAIGEW
jgi:2-polyprenyl-3-methyl-5-hydroxy-6-metoxy-1,4-benzoquinol methylase